MYTPAFLEIFIGWVVASLWAMWLQGRVAPWLSTALPWVAGAAVLGGQAIAMMGVVQGTAEATVVAGRWGSAAVVAGVLALELVLTVWSAVRRGPS